MSATIYQFPRPTQPCPPPEPADGLDAQPDVGVVHITWRGQSLSIDDSDAAAFAAQLAWAVSESMRLREEARR